MYTPALQGSRGLQEDGQARGDVRSAMRPA